MDGTGLLAGVSESTFVELSKCNIYADKIARVGVLFNPPSQ